VERIATKRRKKTQKQEPKKPVLEFSFTLQVIWFRFVGSFLVHEKGQVKSDALTPVFESRISPVPIPFSSDISLLSLLSRLKTSDHPIPNPLLTTKGAKGAKTNH
jgi:hypothetical protein